MMALVSESPRGHTARIVRFDFNGRPGRMSLHNTDHVVLEPNPGCTLDLAWHPSTDGSSDSDIVTVSGPGPEADPSREVRNRMALLSNTSEMFDQGGCHQWELRRHHASVRACAWGLNSGASGLIATGDSVGCVRVFNGESNWIDSVELRLSGQVAGVAFSPCMRHVFAVCSDGSATVWDISRII